MKRLIAILISGISSLGFATEPTSYCHDKEVNAYWEDLAIQAMDSSDVIRLYKLRKDLCAQIDRGEISVENATDLFEYERARVVERLEQGKF